MIDWKIREIIENERDRQDAKWGSIDQHPHSIIEWIIIMKRQLKCAEDEYFNSTSSEMLKSVLKATAVGVACLEQHGWTESINEDPD